MGRRYRKTAQHTSLLTGILFDVSGDRYVPSHTSRRKKRYRYYAQVPGDDKDASLGHGTRRLPALEIEKPVKAALIDILASHDKILAIIGQSISATELRGVFEKARKLATRLETANTSDWREALGGVLERVTLGTGMIRLKISRNGLGEHLEHPVHPDTFDDKHWYYEIPYTLHKRGKQLRIVPEGLGNTAPPELDPTLFKLMRRAHDWRRQLETGPPQSITDLAMTNAVNASYFTRVLRLTYLAPDIVEMIVTGRQPPNLSANRLVRMLDLPMDWSGQREYLGLPAALSRTTEKPRRDLSQLPERYAPEPPKTVRDRC